MNRDLQLQVQAYLDGELSADEARRIEELLTDDQGAKALFDELRATQTVLRGNELEGRVPETREFYWSKIARRIEKEGAEVAESQSRVLLPWLRWLIPSAALGLVLVFFALSERFEGDPGLVSVRPVMEVADVETPLEESSLIAFRSEAEGLSVVWVNTR